MKKILLSLAIIAGVGLTSVKAQEGFKGKWFVGGTVGYEHSQVDGVAGAKDVKTDKITITPIIGTFIAPTFAVGAQVGYVHEKTGDVKENIIVIAPLARKYWGVNDKVFLFAQGLIPIKFYDEADKTTWGIAVNPGIDVFISPNWTFETTIGELGYQDNDGDSSFKLGLDFANVKFGVKYVF